MKAIRTSVDKLVNSFNPHQTQRKFYVVQDTWESVKESTKFINNSNGMPLNYRDRGILDLFIQLNLKNKRLIDYSWLQEKFSKGSRIMSQRNIYRILQNFSNCFTCKFYNSIEFEGKKYFNKILIIPTSQLQNILDDAYNQLLQSKDKRKYKFTPSIPDIREQKTRSEFLPNQTKISTPIYSNIRKQENNITTTELDSTNARAREEIHQTNKIINQKTLVVAKLMEPPKVFCKEPPEEKPESTAKIVKFMSPIQENPVSNSTRSGSLQSEVANPQAFTTSNVITTHNLDDHSLLYSELFKHFGSLACSSLIKQLKFIMLGKKKIGIKINNVNLSNEEKIQLRACIKNVYGEDTKIVALGSKSIDYPPNKATTSNEGRGQIVPFLSENQEKSITAKVSSQLSTDIWGLIRKKIADKFGEWICNFWLGRVEVIIDNDLKQLTLKAPTSLSKEYIYQNYLYDIEEIAAYYDFSVGLGFGNEKIYYYKSNRY